MGERSGHDHHQVIAQYKQVSTHLTNSIKNLYVNPKFEPKKKHLNKSHNIYKHTPRKQAQSIVKLTEKGTKNFQKRGTNRDQNFQKRDQ